MHDVAQDPHTRAGGEGGKEEGKLRGRGGGRKGTGMECCICILKESRHHAPSAFGFTHVCTLSARTGHTKEKVIKGHYARASCIFESDDDTGVPEHGASVRTCAEMESDHTVCIFVSCLPSLNPKPQTLSPQLSTLNHQPSTLKTEYNHTVCILVHPALTSTLNPEL